MRNLILIASVVALASCQSEPAEEPVAEDTVAMDTVPEPEPADMVAPGSPGDYEVTGADGTVFTASLKADGTYTDTAADGTVMEEGTYAVQDGKTCFTPTTEGAEPMCFTESERAADGSFTATPDEGEPVTVKPKPAA